MLAGGTFTKSAGAGTTIVSMPLNNQGTVSASAGTVRLAAVGSHSGSLAASTGAALHVNANQTLAAGVDVGGQGTLQVNCGHARGRSDASAVDPTLELAGGYLTGPGTLTVDRAANWPSSAQLGPRRQSDDDRDRTCGDARDERHGLPSGRAELRAAHQRHRHLDGVPAAINTLDGTGIEIGSGGKLDSQSDASIADAAPGAALPRLHVFAAGR